MHPGAWLVWGMGAGIVTITTTNPFYLVPLFCASWFVHSICRTDHPTSRAFSTFVLFGLIAMAVRTALVLAGPINRGSVAVAFLEGLRLAVLLAVFGTFNSVIDPFAVLKLAPRRFHEPALAAALAVSIAPRMITTARRVKEAQSLRGIDVSRWRSVRTLAVPVLETGMEEALTLAESMDARGHGRGRRSRYRREMWTWRAWLVTLGSIAAAAAFVAADLRGRGALSVSTFPLRWPDASAGLEVALLALSLPGWLSVSTRHSTKTSQRPVLQEMGT